MPRKCPVCGKPAKKIGSDVIRRCINAQCPAQVKQRLIHWGSRNAMDIDGLGPKLINKLVEKNLVKNAADIYELKLEDLKKIERMGKKSSKKLLQEIEESKNKGLSRVLYGLGIPFVGEHIARVLKKNYGTIDKLMNASKEELESINEIGPKIAEGVISYFKENKNMELIKRLEKFGIKLSSKKNKYENFLEGKKFVFTGTLNKYTRNEASEIVQKVGGRVISSISGEIDYVVVGENPGSKLERAKNENLKLLKENEFLKIIDEKKLI